MASVPAALAAEFRVKTGFGSGSVLFFWWEGLVVWVEGGIFGKANAAFGLWDAISYPQNRIFADKITKVMTVTIETSGVQEIEQLLQVLKSLNIKAIKVHPTPNSPAPSITKGDKNLDAKELFGIWKENPRTIEQIRSNSDT